ncbi:MAG: DNA-processing protein DprA [Bacteroidia bacterium]|nr:DNA-protecting protein DprA [Bacteroidia bacterium]MDW8157837.1 DNA-processing protein DprA [Bacteroidia bacterium]
MIYSESALNILTILSAQKLNAGNSRKKLYERIGPAWIFRNLKEAKSTEEIVRLLTNENGTNEKIKVLEFEEARERAKQMLKSLEGFASGMVAFTDKDFAVSRAKTINNGDRPVLLFYRGDLSLLHASNKNVAVIGVLTPAPEVERIERKVVKELVKNGATIVSGLARGCDTIAHEQALESGGKTIAILPSPLSDILPARNKKLADKIVEKGGLLITEYWEDAHSKVELKRRYVDRDRLQALFSDYIILSASYDVNDKGLDCGSRHAMERAQSYKIPRAVIYDQEIHQSNPMYDLNRRLIREDPDITIINEKNLENTIKKIVGKSNSIPDSQLSLFENT